MARAANPPKTLSGLIDQVEKIREELLVIQRNLEKMEPADRAKTDRDENPH